jgi:hypothetical protein
MRERRRSIDRRGKRVFDCGRIIFLSDEGAWRKGGI